MKRQPPLTEHEFNEYKQLSADIGLDHIRQQPQTQTSLDTQLRILVLLANRYGLYDAADYLRKNLR